ncbi:MAG: chemotaxis protein CheA [Planctomycetota bacterium]
MNELAASVIDVEPDDLQKLGQIHAYFIKIAGHDDMSPLAQRLAQAGAGIAEKLILREYDNPDAGVAQMGQAVEAVQQICGRIERGQNCEDVELPGWFECEPEKHADKEQTTQDTHTQTKSPDPDSLTEEKQAECDYFPPDADASLMGEFIAESLDHIQNSEAALLDLETAADPEKINAVFRAFHTIKGTSGFLGLPVINKVAHRAETLLDRARKEEITMEGGYADLAFDSCDVLKRLIEYVRVRMEGTECERPEGVEQLLARLESPDVETDSTPEAPRLGDLLVAQGKATREDVEAAAAGEGEGKLGTKLIRKNAAIPKDVAQALRTQKAATGQAVAEATVRIGTTRLDNFINMVGELVIAQSMVSQDEVIVTSDSHTLTRNVSQLSKITRELQELSLSMRMVPLKNTFQKMARLVRDLARKSGKSVRFVTEGEETEIDRNMVESINDPLVHMMRNCVDHGIEPPEVRRESGKPETGTVTLRAYHAAGNVVIEIIDDGRGLDSEKILAKAMEKGLVEPGKELSDAEIYNIIMMPGFSTAAKVTDVSGRGVGTDVVKRNIEALRGKVEIASEKSKGTTFTVRLPLTLAIIDGMLILVGNERYILPTIAIREAFRPEKNMISTVQQKGEMVMVRGNIISIVRLHRLFGVIEANENLDNCLLVIIEVNGKQCAMLIDEIVGQQQVVIKSLGSVLGNVSGVSGAAILGDGRVGLILDVSGILAIAQEQTSGPEPQENP